VDLRRLRAEEWIAGACGAALLVALFLDWLREGSASRNGWEAFAALDVVLAIVALMALALTIVTAAHRSQAVPLAIGALLVLVGLIASVWLGVRVASVERHREVGLWIGLAACVGCTLSALISIRDDRFPRAVVEAAHVDVPTLPAPPREGAGEAGS
jgi:hypothetical protein